MLGLLKLFCLIASNSKGEHKTLEVYLKCLKILEVYFYLPLAKIILKSHLLYLKFGRNLYANNQYRTYLLLIKVANFYPNAHVTLTLCKSMLCFSCDIKACHSVSPEVCTPLF